MLLVAGAVVLLVSIVIGQKLGDRVLLQTERRVPLGSELVTPVPQTQPSDQAPLKNWKRLQVVSVATDPAFPDPRVTRPPTPTPQPYVAPRPKPSKAPKPSPSAGAAGGYTSPPLPIPIASHAPGETPAPEESLSPEGRANVAPSATATLSP